MHSAATVKCSFVYIFNGFGNYYFGKLNTCVECVYTDIIYIGRKGKDGSRIVLSRINSCKTIAVIESVIIYFCYAVAYPYRFKRSAAGERRFADIYSRIGKKYIFKNLASRKRRSPYCRKVVGKLKRLKIIAVFKSFFAYYAYTVIACSYAPQRRAARKQLICERIDLRRQRNIQKGRTVFESALSDSFKVDLRVKINDALQRRTILEGVSAYFCKLRCSAERYAYKL